MLMPLQVAFSSAARFYDVIAAAATTTPEGHNYVQASHKKSKGQGAGGSAKLRLADQHKVTKMKPRITLNRHLIIPPPLGKTTARLVGIFLASLIAFLQVVQLYGSPAPALICKMPGRTDRQKPRAKKYARPSVIQDTTG